MAEADLRAAALMRNAGALQGVRAVRKDQDEVVAEADRDVLVATHDHPARRSALCLRPVMDICGVDWPERPERFDVVYNLLSVALNQRLRVIVTTDETRPCPR